MISSLLTIIHEALRSTHDHHDVIDAVKHPGELIHFKLCIKQVVLRQILREQLLAHFALLGGDYLENHPEQLVLVLVLIQQPECFSICTSGWIGLLDLLCCPNQYLSARSE